MYRAVLLDVYGTLVHDDEAEVSAVAAVVAGLAGVEPDVVEREWSTRIWAMADTAHGDGFRSLADLTTASLTQTAEHFGVEIDAAQVTREQTAFWRTTPLFADALPFLAAVPVPVCLVSDADRGDLDAVLHRHGITVAGVVTSEDARAYKPRPEPFRLALRQLSLAATDVIHVGDSVTSDIGGAAALGIASAHLDRSGSRTTAHSLATLTDLLPLFAA
ncbi:HAD family hydrolase [Actinoplanes palleronii]|uniref:2-haloacid dehalogenase/putative hydrolase of the HAD superfamily n=1 Tax=Actinoplanes palleronii TaxID=113570 RepID=A0ABQ4BPC1_9ACTN|nr:HAD family hydrolase [Actinoplanes palleronii]GIE72532.1 hypothetical protein Apa02nite_086400 [Actinoplanes palleronii]